MFSRRVIELTKSFFPRGRAFRLNSTSLKYKFIKSLAEIEDKAIQDAYRVQDTILPDNPNFTEEDTTDWERRMGIITNKETLLSDRNLALLRKINHPGTIKARQHFLYLERQLRLANFNLYVKENRFAVSETSLPELGISEMGVVDMGGVLGDDKYFVLDPDELVAEKTQMGLSEMGTLSQMGGIDSAFNYRLLVNHIDEELDSTFFQQPGDNVSGVAEMGGGDEMGYRVLDWNILLRDSFFVGGQNLGTPVDIPVSRYRELRQLILRIKPAQTFCFLFVNLIPDDLFNGGDFNNDFDNSYNNV